MNISVPLDIRDTNAVNKAAHDLYLSMNGRNLCDCGREKESVDARCLTCEDILLDARMEEVEDFDTPDAM